MSVVTSVNASWHVKLTCQLLKLLCDNSNCKGIITIKVNIYILWTWLLHFHALELQLYTSVLDSGVVSNLLEIVNHNRHQSQRGRWQLIIYLIIPENCMRLKGNWTERGSMVNYPAWMSSPIVVMPTTGRERLIRTRLIRSNTNSKSI